MGCSCFGCRAGVRRPLAPPELDRFGFADLIFFAFIDFFGLMPYQVLFFFRLTCSRYLAGLIYAKGQLRGSLLGNVMGLDSKTFVSSTYVIEKLPIKMENL